jgi:hypothetical protein
MVDPLARDRVDRARRVADERAAVALDVGATEDVAAIRRDERADACVAERAGERAAADSAAD